MSAQRQEPVEEDHAALLDRIVQQDETALEALFEATRRRVFGLTLNILGDQQLAEEATLDAYTQVWRTAGSYQGSRGSVLGWMLTIARTRAIDKLRSNQRVAEDLLDHATDLCHPDRGPEAVAGLSEDSQRVRGALDRIPAEQRQAIAAAFFGGLSHRQIASTLGIPLGTVKRRIRNGLERLRDHLGMRAEGLA